MNKKNLILLASLLVLLLIFILAKKKEHVETDFQFLTVDSLNVASISFVSDADTVEISKIDGNWQLTYPVKADVNMKRLSQFFNDVVKTKVPINPMAENKESLVKYNVDENQGYHITMKSHNGSILADFRVSEGTNYIYSYIRKSDENKVYQVKSNIYITCRPQIQGWRSNMILEVKQEDVAKVHIMHGDNDYEMLRSTGEKGVEWTYKDKNEEFVVKSDDKQLRKFYGVFNGFRSGIYHDDEWDELSGYFDNPIVVAEIYLNDGSMHSITIAGMGEDKLLLKRDNFTYTIFEATKDILGRLTFTADSFKEDETD